MPGLTTATILGAWVAAGLTLFIYSFLYKDNPLFKLGEHLYVGISVGYSVVLVWHTVFLRLLWEPLRKSVSEAPALLESYILLIPAILGVLMLVRFIPRIAWLSRIAFAFVVGFGSGVAIPRTVSALILKQIEDTVNPLITMGANGLSMGLDLASPQSGVNTIILLIGVVSVLFYFFFSVEHTGPGMVTARTGVYFVMIAFGAAFGYTVMSRMSLLIGRFSDLIKFSGAEYGYATLILLAVTVLTLIGWEALVRQKRQEV
ncbi:MAG TPA: hypothetical protein VF879_06775 [Nitrospirales bacterium]